MPEEQARRAPAWLRWSRGIGLLLAAFGVLLGGGLVLLDSPLGHRLMADRVAAFEPASGLRVRVGRIEGSLFTALMLREVTFSDPKGRFLTVPETALDWRPLAWARGLLDIRSLTLRRATLLRAPELKIVDPEAPILPDFDIRLDRLRIESMAVAEGVAGARRRIDVAARADIRAGRALIDLTGKLGGRDRIALHLDSAPAKDRFDLDLRYDAPKDGLLAALSGIPRDVRARIAGKGLFSDWHGWGWASQNGARLAGFLIENRAGAYRVIGQILPGSLAPTAARAALGDRISLSYAGTFDRARLDGRLIAAGAAFRVTGEGALDLTANRAENITLAAKLTQPRLVIASPELTGVSLDAAVDGRFADLSIPHVLRVQGLKSGTVVAQDIITKGTARWVGKQLTLPLALGAARLRTGNAQIDPRLDGARLTGTVLLDGDAISSDALVLAARGLSARLVLRGDLRRGGFALAGPAAAQGIAVPGAGLVDARAKMLFTGGRGLPWLLKANLAGTVARIDNATFASLSGGNVRFAGSVRLAQSGPIQIDAATLNSPKLSLALSSRIGSDGQGTLTGKGRQSDVGPFTINAAITKAGANADLVFASPLPAASVRDVHVALSPEQDGYLIQTRGDSRLGPFTGLIGLRSAPGGPTRLDIRQFNVYQTEVTGGLELVKGGATGTLSISGGGIQGAVSLAPRDNGQGVIAQLSARQAEFGGVNPIRIGLAKLDLDGLFAAGNSTVQGSLKAEGISSGKLFIGRFAGDAVLVNGSGSVTASLTGRRGTNFALQGTAAFQPDKVIAYVAGNYGGRSIVMPRRAVLDREAEGWRLQPTQVDFGRGVIIASGIVVGGPTALNLQVSQMPLSVLDIVLPDLGLGGLVSGLIDYRNDHTGVPVAHAALQIKGLTRAGLLLSSRPLDLALVGGLDASALQMRAVAKDAGVVRGRLQARISQLPRGDIILDRLRAGQLRAQVRYGGPADALWRLLSVSVLDLTGPVGLAVDVVGTIDNPVLTGAVASNDLRVQSSITGTDIRGIKAGGSFRDSRLSLASFSGTTPNGGKVSGSGTIDLSNLATKGAGLDLRIAASNAELVNRVDMGATVTGPLRLISDGTTGTIAGRVNINKARWSLGRAATALDLPSLATREINARADSAPARVRALPWKYFIDAAGESRIEVRGLGLVSEWGADLRVRGDVSAPQIFGGADLVRGGYEFAGKRFDLTRGRIRFVGEVPVDPLLDILAQGDANGVSAKIAISGSGTKPSITFSSTPALPEEELLSRLLFGSSITQISAPEAVQLAAALASLRGGGGLDPINRLRGAIGLDRLRIVSADPALGRSTAVAVGKYLGRRVFVELITDGRGYNASSAEFRITRWLALLGSISTIGGNSINLKASKDY
jgi:translocation and assembly module TamB